MSTNPKCPVCKTEDLILEPPSWIHHKDNKISIPAYCLKCKAEFDLQADLINFVFVESTFKYTEYPY